MRGPVARSAHQRARPASSSPSALRRTVRTAQPRSSRSPVPVARSVVSRGRPLDSHGRGHPPTCCDGARRGLGPVARSSAAPPPMARRRLPGAVAFGTPVRRRSVARSALVRRSFACGPRCRWREQFLNPPRGWRKCFDQGIFVFLVAPQEFPRCPQTRAVVHVVLHRLSTGLCTVVGDEMLPSCSFRQARAGIATP
jgi:hypothetical protein